MKPLETNATLSANDASGAAPPLACPLCSGQLRATQRRFIDVVTAYFLPHRHGRFYCRSLGCGWQGNLRIPLNSGNCGDPYDGRNRVLQPSLTGLSGGAARHPR